jgi:hypothetical protein
MLDTWLSIWGCVLDDSTISSTSVPPRWFSVLRYDFHQAQLREENGLWVLMLLNLWRWLH